MIFALIPAVFDLRSLIQPRESPLRRLQPIPLIILVPLPLLNNMKSINNPPLFAQIPLTLVKQIPMNQHQITRLHLPHDVLFFLYLFILPILHLPRIPRKLSSLILHHLRPRPPPSDQPLPDPTPKMAPRQKTQTPILPRRILKRIPKPNRRRRVGVQKRAILMRRHRSPYLGLLADNHALQTPWVLEPEILCYIFWQRPLPWHPLQQFCKRGGEAVEKVTDLVDG